MVLGKLPVPGRPSDLANSRAKAYCAHSAGGGFSTFLLSSITSLLFLTLWETVQYRLKYCLKEPLNPEQPMNVGLYKLDSCNFEKSSFVDGVGCQGWMRYCDDALFTINADLTKCLIHYDRSKS